MDHMGQCVAGPPVAGETAAQAALQADGRPPSQRSAGASQHAAVTCADRLLQIYFGSSP